MCKRVIEKIAAKYEKVREGVKKAVGGQILEYEAKTILKEGMAKGREEGIEKGIDSFASLTAKLLETKRLEDLKRAAEDTSYRKQMYKEFHIEV